MPSPLATYGEEDEEYEMPPAPVLTDDHVKVKNYCSALGELIIGKFAKMKTEFVSEEMVLCTRMDTHDGIPVTVTKAKVPFLTVNLYK